MAFTPNLNPAYALGPYSWRVNVPATAKTVFNDASNTAVLVPAQANNRVSVGLLYVQNVLTVVSGKLMLYLFDGVSTYQTVDDVAVSAQTPGTTTAGNKTTWATWSSAQPLIIPEGHSLLVATSVAQTAGALIAHAQLGKIY